MGFLSLVYSIEMDVHVVSLISISILHPDIQTFDSGLSLGRAQVWGCRVCVCVCVA